MKTQNNPTFALPELQQAIDEARPLLEGAEAAKNRVSNEIKALENYLQSLNLKHEFRYEISSSKSVVGNDAAQSLEYSGTANALMEDELLVWAPDQKGTWRLFFELKTCEGSIDIGLGSDPYMWSEEWEQREFKPLIECSFDIRKRVYQDHLVNFVKQLGEDLRVERKKEPALDDEIPF